MPILDGTMDHGIIGPAILRGELNVVRRQIDKRFGPLPPWVDERWAALSYRDVEALSLRIFDAENLEKLFKR